MNEIVSLTLPAWTVVQIVDGLAERVKTWKGTERYLRLGYTESDCQIEECSELQEAKRVWESYETIISLIERQFVKRTNGLTNPK